MNIICPLCFSPLEWLYDTHTDVTWLVCFMPDCGYAKTDESVMTLKEPDDKTSSDMLLGTEF